MGNCIFCKIAKHEIPKEFEYEDDEIMVFADIHPVASTHLLAVPKNHIEDFSDFADQKLHSKIIGVLQKMIDKKVLSGKGYKILVNGGGAQIINHLHFHLIGPIGLHV